MSTDTSKLHDFFNPQSIAIVGVSHEPHKVGYLVAKNIIDQGFLGELYFINPHAEKILNKKVYKSLSEIKNPIDLVILALPAGVALQLLKEVYELGIKNVLIYAAGFKEVGVEGKDREKELVEKAHEYNLTILGPNCLGFINTSRKINATFLKHISPVGNISIISQSGALGSVLVDYFVDHKHLGLSYFISLGNKTVLDESDCLEFLLKDTHTDVIGMYLEDVKDGKRFREILTKVTRVKPVVIIKSGTSKEGSKAALSHTGGLGGNAQAYEALFKQSGAIQADNYKQFISILKLFSFAKVPSSSNILVLSNAGGIGVLLTDELVKHKLKMITVSEKTKKEIEQSMNSNGPKHISIHNPIDLLGDASAFDYKLAVNDSIQQQDIGAVIVLLTPQANTQITETAKVLIEAQHHFVKPIYPIFMGENSVKMAHILFEEHKVASFTSYETLAAVIGKVVDSYDHVPKGSSSHYSPESLSLLAHEKQITEKVEASEGKKVLNFEESMELLRLAGVKTIPVHHVYHEEELKHVLEKIGFPLVAKVASNIITHKTEVNGVITGINSYEDAKKAFTKLSKIPKSEGCYLQKQVKGHELFVGAKQDPLFGPMVVFGLGGIYVELLKETFGMIYPFTFKEFSKKVEASKLNPLVKGFRNTAQLDLRELYSVGMILGALLYRFEELDSLDLNPLFLTERGLIAADSRFIRR